MKTRLHAILAVLFIISLISFPSPPSAPSTYAQNRSAQTDISTPTDDKSRVAAALQSSPVMFIENVGQFDEGARFQVRGSDSTVYLANDAIWFTLQERPQKEKSSTG
ncbi:MAG: hypothetical protein Q7O66_10000, partial [Dehalococcoidia bacterium]|nr:hypothetical protein [Dehalococcoidia bacterium]